MTDTTTTTAARRQLLAVLLDRVERGALLPAEAPLLRACVTAEQADAAETTADLQAQLDHVFRERDEWWNTADRQSETLGRLLDQTRAVLADVLGKFIHKTHPGEPCLQTGHVPVATVERWHALLRGEQTTASVADCSCGTPGIGNYEGPQADCPVHGALDAPSSTPDAAPVPQCRAEYHAFNMPSGRCRLAEGHDGYHRDAMVEPDGLNWDDNAAIYPATKQQAPTEGADQ